MSLPIDPANGVTSGQIGMSLATIAYAAEKDIPSLLSTTELTKTWKMVWFSCNHANQVFIAKDSVSGQYAVSIRGTAGDFFSSSFWINWFEQDLNVLEMVDWPWAGAPSGCKIAQGTLDGLNSLLSLKDSSGKTIEQFLQAELTAVNTLTAVVGHSLGGTLGSVLPAYLNQAIATGGTGFWGVTFAGATPGNKELADWLDSSFNGSSGRFWNDKDVVPHAWKELDWIADSFSGGPSCPLEVKAVIDTTRVILWGLSDNYETLGSGIPLLGSTEGGDSWFQEVGHQHDHNTYLELLGAPAIPLPKS